MIKIKDDMEVYENQIETLFIQYCEDNNLQEALDNRRVDDNDAYCIWEYIYKILFKPDRNTIRLNNKASKLDYSDIYTLNEILSIYIELCFRYKILPVIEDFSTLTGISRETLYSWEKKEYRAAEPGATFKHSDINKKIREASQRMGIKDLHGNPIGQQSLANNWDGMGLNFTQKEATAQAEAWGIPKASREEIAQRHGGCKELPQKPDFD